MAHTAQQLGGFPFIFFFFFIYIYISRDGVGVGAWNGNWVPFFSLSFLLAQTTRPTHSLLGRGWMAVAARLPYLCLVDVGWWLPLLIISSMYLYIS